MTATSDCSPRLVCLFHMNLAFSSLEAEMRSDVIDRCYWPMLRLASSTPFPIAIEATGWTLGQVAEIDPAWVSEARRLIELGRVELVGSAHAQTAMPLLPEKVNSWNLRLGLESYASFLAVRPRIALVCEQAYSPGLVKLYEEAGYEGIIVDWENAYRSHHEWRSDVRRHPQVALGTSASIPILWSESIAFQKFQRFAHGELSLDRYVDFVADEVDETGGSMIIYANDAEVFDHRPGRFAAEPEIEHGEWERIGEALTALAVRGVGVPSLPSQLLAELDQPSSGQRLRLEAPAQPVPVKKQDKYNVGRWAVSGRDDIGINTRCWRIYNALIMMESESPEDWCELCELWASDFRTHITDARWNAMQAALDAIELRLALRPPSAPVTATSPVTSGPVPGVERTGDLLHLACGEVMLTLNCRRGLAVESFTDLRVSKKPIVGTIEHGFFSNIELGADWYTGNLVQEAPLRHKITDLERCEPRIEVWENGGVRVSAEIRTELGPIAKRVVVDADGGVSVETTIGWQELPPGSLRLGHVTLLPHAFDRDSLWFGTHNGGTELEVHQLRGAAAFDHGGAVSSLVSSGQGLGLTEGFLLMGDANHFVRVEFDQSVAKPLGLITYRPMTNTFFLCAAFSLSESDDTRRGSITRAAGAPQRFKYRLSAALGDSR